MSALLLALGALVGAVLGLTGAGGGILAVPALVAVLDWPLQQAAPVALIATALGAGAGAVDGLRRGLVRYRAALLMALFSLPFTQLGLQLAQRLPARALLLMFAVVVVLVAVRLLHNGDDAATGGRGPRGHIDPDTGRFDWTWATAALVGGIGAIGGLLTGLLGVGGGFVIVPALRRFTDMSMHGIVATSLLIVALISSGGVLSAWLQGAQLPAGVTLPFAGGTLAGMLLGRALARRLSARHVQRGFAALLLTVAASLALKALH